MLLAVFASLAYRKKITVAINEEVHLIDEYIRVPWEAIQWHHINRVSKRNGTNIFVIKNGEKYIYYNNNDSVFREFSRQFLASMPPTILLLTITPEVNFTSFTKLF